MHRLLPRHPVRRLLTLTPGKGFREGRVHPTKEAGIERGKESWGKAEADKGGVGGGGGKQKKKKKREENSHKLARRKFYAKSAVSKQQITEARMQCRGRAYVTREAGLASHKIACPALPLSSILHTLTRVLAMRGTPKGNSPPLCQVIRCCLNYNGKWHPSPTPYGLDVTSVLRAL